jgi:hypothetical protein
MADSRSTVLNLSMIYRHSLNAAPTLLVAVNGPAVAAPFGSAGDRIAARPLALPKS